MKLLKKQDDLNKEMVKALYLYMRQRERKINKNEKVLNKCLII